MPESVNSDKKDILAGEDPNFSMSSSFVTNPPQSMNNGKQNTQNLHSDSDTLFDESDRDEKQNASSPFHSELSPFESPPRSPTRSNTMLSRSSHDFQTSSFLNDTRAQFDLDIDIEKLKSRQSGRGNALKRISQVESLPDSPNYENLIKMLTDCKIQLKLYQDFLQELISKNSLDVGDFDDLHNSLKTQKSGKESRENEDMAILIEDLYASLEEAQGKWMESEKRAGLLKLALSNLAVHFGLLHQEPLDQAEHIKHVLEEQNEELARLRANAKAQEDEINRLKDSASKTEQEMVSLKAEFEQKSPGSEEVKGLRDFIEQQKEEIERYRLSSEESQKARALAEQRPEHSEIESLKAQLEEQNAKIIKLQALNENKDTLSKEQGKEIDRLRVSGGEIEEKFAEYEHRIDQLQREANSLRDASRSSVGDLDKEREAEMYRLLYQETQQKLDTLEDSLSERISALSNQLSNKKKELLSMKSELLRLENSEKDLQAAERVLKSEKSQLFHQVEKLTKEKEALAAKKAEQNGSLQHLVDAQETFQDLFAYDVETFSQMFKYYGQISQDDSLEEPRRSLHAMISVVNSGVRVLEQPSPTVIENLENHEYLSRFFRKATEKLVIDYLSCFGELEPAASKATPKKTTDNLRIEELMSRLKRERETRKYENEQAKARFADLEAEISRLRRRLLKS